MHGREDYQERVNARRDRFERRADVVQKGAEAAAAGARQIADGIPLGQPILVGHHSEKRHRRDAGRIERGYHKAHKLGQKAEGLRQRAGSVGKGGISSDDPDAVRKLRDKLAGLEAEQVLRKRGNAAWRAAQKRPEVLDDGGKFGDLPEGMRAMLRTWTPPYSFVRVPFELKNLGAKVRSVRKRIAALEAAAAAPVRETVRGVTAAGIGWTVAEARDVNRVLVVFEDRISRDHCQTMRRWGFKWNRTEEAWSRMLGDGAWSAALWAVYGGRCSVCQGSASCSAKDGTPRCREHGAQGPEPGPGGSPVDGGAESAQEAAQAPQEGGNGAANGPDAVEAAPAPEGLTWTSVGAGYSRAAVRAAIAGLEWHSFRAGLELSGMGGLTIVETIRELRVPRVDAVAEAALGTRGFFGLHAHYANGEAWIYCVNEGSHVVPVCSRFEARRWTLVPKDHPARAPALDAKLVTERVRVAGGAS